MRQRGKYLCSALDRSKSLVWLSAALILIFPEPAAAAPPSVGLLAAGVVGQAKTGTIKGRLVWGGENIPPAKVLAEKGQANKNPEICAKDAPIVSRELVVDPKTKGVAYGFAYLVRPKGDAAAATQALVAKAPKVVLDQKNCEFQPYVLPLHKDQTLVIRTSDPLNHNIRFAGFNNPGINQVVSGIGQIEVKLVPDRLPLELHCDIHPWMKGYLMVFDHPFFATTGPDGAFEIKDVPEGRQNLVVWQEKVGYASPGGGRGISLNVHGGEVVDVGEIKLDPAKVR